MTSTTFITMLYIANNKERIVHKEMAAKLAVNF